MGWRARITTPRVNMRDLAENGAVGSEKRGPNDRGVAKWQRPALVAVLVVMALIACADALRGTLFRPMSVHRNVRFTNGGMSVEATTVPRVNGVYFEIRNDSKERHQVVVLSEGIPYRTKGHSIYQRKLRGRVINAERSHAGRPAQLRDGLPALARMTGQAPRVCLCFGQTLSVSHDDVGQLAGTGGNLGAANVGRRDHQEPVADLQG
jgi:hypothetical protein